MPNSRSRGATIKLFLVDGTPEGIRLIERMGWTGSLLAFSRADYSSVIARPEISRVGVYVLSGPDPEGLGAQRIYIGEGDLKTRLASHQKDKDFWTQGFLLTAKDKSLNKAHVRYLEARFIALAKEAANATLDNGQAPEPTFLGESEEADMETYLDNALPLFPIAGVHVFEIAEPTATYSVDDADGSPEPTLNFPRLYLAADAAQAEGEDRPKGFLVFEGARARKETKTMAPSYEALRQTLIDEGILIEEGDSLVLAKSHLFDSPSAAASVLIGGSRNGRTVWKQVGTEKTLKDLQSEAAAEEPFTQPEGSQTEFGAETP